MSVIIDQERIVTWVLPMAKTTKVFFLKQGGFQEIYELHSGPSVKYPKSHPNSPRKVKSEQIQEVTLKGETVTDVL